MVTCPKCGSNNSTGSRFCSECGSPLEENSNSEKQDSTPQKSNSNSITSNGNLKYICGGLIVFIIACILLSGGSNGSVEEVHIEETPAPNHHVHLYAIINLPSNMKYVGYAEVLITNENNGTYAYQVLDGTCFDDGSKLEFNSYINSGTHPGKPKQLLFSFENSEGEFETLSYMIQDSDFTYVNN